jgi:hypothetical protein
MYQSSTPLGLLDYVIHFPWVNTVRLSSRRSPQLLKPHPFRVVKNQKSEGLEFE